MAGLYPWLCHHPDHNPSPPLPFLPAQYEYAGGTVERWACVLKTGEALFPSFSYHPAALRRRDMAAAAMPTLLDVASFATNGSINSVQHAAVGDRHGFGGDVGAGCCCWLEQHPGAPARATLPHLRCLPSSVPFRRRWRR